MNTEDERILFYGIVVFGKGEPALNLAAIARPVDIARFSPRWLYAVFEVRDLWPESLEAVGASRKTSLLMRVLKRVARLLYSEAAHIVVVTFPFKEHLQRYWGIPENKISVIINGVDHRLFVPQSSDDQVVKEFNLEHRFVVGYFGTIGNAHGIETLVRAAQIIEDKDPEVLFLVIGEGADKALLQDLAVGANLKNIQIFPGQPRFRMPRIIASSDICLVLLKDAELFKTVIPTKLLEFMSCGRAVVAAVAGEATRFLETSGGGVCVPPGNATAIAESILSLKADQMGREQFGTNARKFIVTSATRERTAQEYISLLEAILKKSARQVVEPEQLGVKSGGGRCI